MDEIEKIEEQVADITDFEIDVQLTILLLCGHQPPSPESGAWDSVGEGH